MRKSLVKSADSAAGKVLSVIGKRPGLFVACIGTVAATLAMRDLMKESQQESATTKAPSTKYMPGR